MSDKQVEIWDMAYKSTTSVRDTIWAVYCRGFKDGVTDTTDRIKDGSCFACKEIYNQALEDFTRQLSVRLIELPLDDLIVADILNDVKGIYEQLKK